MPLAEGYIKLRSKAEEFFENVKTSNFLSQKKEIPLPYAYSCNNYMDSILSNTVVRKSLQAFTDKYCTKQIENIKSIGILVTKNNCPRCYDALQSCYKSLNIDNLPDVYLYSRLKGINALSVGTDNSPIILVSPKAVMQLTEGELKFILGHELGHIAQKKLECQTAKGILDNLNNKSEILGSIVSDILEVPLNQWYRCNEYTADRAGLICAGDIKYAESIFKKIGLTKASSSILDDYYELDSMHPTIRKRFDELSKFYKHYFA